MHITRKLATAVAALGLTAALTSTASAQNIAEPVGHQFAGTGGQWNFSIGAGLSVRCASTSQDGTPAPASVGVAPNVLGGPASSTRMARYRPAFNDCTMTRGSITLPARVSTECDWAHAIDTFNTGSGASRVRVGLGLGCTEPGAGLVLTDGTCTVTVPPQTVLNQAGQNLGLTGMFTALNVQQGLIRTVDAGCAPVANPTPLASMAGTFVFQNPGVHAQL